MRKLEPRRDLMRKIMIAVAAALSLGTAMMATGTMAFGRGGAEATLAAEVIFLTTAAVSVVVSRVVISAEAIGAVFDGLYGFGGVLPYYGYGYGCGSSC
jgi:hypothetical protein